MPSSSPHRGRDSRRRVGVVGHCASWDREEPSRRLSSSSPPPPLPSGRPVSGGSMRPGFDTLWGVYPALWLAGAWVGGAQVSVTLEPRYVGAGKPWRAVTKEFLATVQIASAWDPLGDAGLPCPIFTAPRRPPLSPHPHPQPPRSRAR
uniref:Uncharacterized protein n=1 Tax=Oryza meridionalis TaxID=40149 RepID=A0A0E0DR43_9ORYZ